MLLTAWFSPCCYHKHQNPKVIVSILSFELERRLKLNVEDVGVLIRHSYWGNSVCFSKLTTPSKLQGRLNLVRINCCFKNTRHLTQTVGKSLDEKRSYSKNVREDLLSTLNTSLKLMRIPYLGLFSFYLNKVKTKQKKIRSRILTS